MYLELESKFWSGEFIWILFLWFLSTDIQYEPKFSEHRKKQTFVVHCQIKSFVLFHKYHIDKAVQFCLSVR